MATVVGVVGDVVGEVGGAALFGVVGRTAVVVGVPVGVAVVGAAVMK